jgi:hypothetical protein
MQGERLLRAAMVVVARAKAEGSTEGPTRASQPSN